VKQENWFQAHPRKAKWLVFLLCLIVVEIAVRIFVWADLLPYRKYQTDRTPYFWANIDPVVGRWRWPNKAWVYRDACMETNYESNSIGARDPERTLPANGAERVVMLGDSFMEGLGVEYGERTSDLLEQMTGIEHLNLGLSDSGTFQECLVYEKFGLRYEHTKVVLYVLPENDFNDNDPGKEHENVYRPFLRKTATGFEVYYTVDFDDRYTGDVSVATVIKNTIDNAIYTANVGRWATRALKNIAADKEPVNTTSRYNAYSAEDIEIMRYALGQLADLVGERPLYLVIVPTTIDLEFAAENGGKSRLVEDMSAFAASRENVRVIDLAPEFLLDSKSTGREFLDYTLGCDGHWSPTGHHVVASTLIKEIHSEGYVNH
jgi:hypothetical protein